jgi:hypothetical protein
MGMWRSERCFRILSHPLTKRRISWKNSNPFLDLMLCPMMLNDSVHASLETVWIERYL